MGHFSQLAPSAGYNSTSIIARKPVAFPAKMVTPPPRRSHENVEWAWKDYVLYGTAGVSALASAGALVTTASGRSMLGSTLDKLSAMIMSLKPAFLLRPPPPPPPPPISRVTQLYRQLIYARDNYLKPAVKGTVLLAGFGGLAWMGKGGENTVTQAQTSGSSETRTPIIESISVDQNVHRPVRPSSSIEDSRNVSSSQTRPPIIEPTSVDQNVRRPVSLSSSSTASTLSSIEYKPWPPFSWPPSSSSTASTLSSTPVTSPITEASSSSSASQNTEPSVTSSPTPTPANASSNNVQASTSSNSDDYQRKVAEFYKKLQPLSLSDCETEYKKLRAHSYHSAEPDAQISRDALHEAYLQATSDVQGFVNARMTPAFSKRRINKKECENLILELNTRLDNSEYMGRNIQERVNEIKALLDEPKITKHLTKVMIHKKKVDDPVGDLGQPSVLYLFEGLEEACSVMITNEELYDRLVRLYGENRPLPAPVMDNCIRRDRYLGHALEVKKPNFLNRILNS